MCAWCICDVVCVRGVYVMWCVRGICVMLYVCGGCVCAGRAHTPHILPDFIPGHDID